MHWNLCVNKISHSCKNIICFKSIVKQTEFECGYVLCVYYILIQINCIITLIIHYVAHIICYVLLYIHIIILYYILKHIVSGSQLKSIQCLIKAPRLSDGLLGKHSYSQNCQNIASFIPSYSDTNIILEYNFLLWGLQAPFIIFVHWLFSFSEKYLACGNLIRGKQEKELFGQNVLFY